MSTWFLDNELSTCYCTGNTKTESNDKPSKGAQFIPQNFDVGSLIQFGDPLEYGVIKELQNECAVVEMVRYTKFLYMYIHSLFKVKFCSYCKD